MTARDSSQNRSSASLFRRVVTAGLLCALFSQLGCSSYELGRAARIPVEPFGRLPTGVGQICTYRTSILGSAVTFVVRDGAVLVGASRGTGWFCWHAQPGFHLIEITADEPARIGIEVAAGRRYHLEQEVHLGFPSVTCRPTWVSEDEGARLAEGLDYEVLVGVPKGEVLPPIVPVTPALRPPVAVLPPPAPVIRALP